MKASKNIRSKERGQSLTEMAMMMSLLLIMLVGIVDLGRGFFVYLALRDAAQEGALFGSTDPTNSTDIETRVRNSSSLLENLSADTNAITTVSTTIIGSACTGGGITVSVTYQNFPITMPFLGSIIGRQTVPITASITDTILNPACP
jgi:Flp pilus assembly protein TadG